MKVSFIRGAEKGYAHYDSSEDAFEYSYDGDDSGVQEVLTTLDEGVKYFTEVVTHETDVEDELDYYFDESREFVSWEKQIEHLAFHLERADFNILYLGE